MLRIPRVYLKTAAIAGCFGLPMVFIAETVSATTLVPHRAVYDMSLLEAKDGSGISSLSGLMVYEFTGSACEGYSVSFRFVTEFQDTAGGARVTDLRASSFEDPKALSFQFLSKTFINQKLVENTRGKAQRNSDASKVELEEPETRELSIARETMFPTEHLHKIIESAQAGNNFVTADVFDGSETGDKVYATTAVIGAVRTEAVPTTDEPGAPASSVKNADVWPVSIAYFDSSEESSGEQTPVYQLGFLLYENGISRKITMDYGDFALSGKLRQLEIHEDPGCTN